MQEVSPAFVFVIVGPLLFAACDKKTSSAPAPSSSVRAAPARPNVQTGGTLDIEIDDEAVTLKVGPAYAIPSRRDDGNLYYFMVFNEKAPDTSCATRIKGDSPVGGDNWAVALDMIQSAAPFKATDKNKEYEDVSASVFFVAKTGPWKGTARGLNPFGTDAEKKLTIVSADAETVSVKVDVSNKSGHVRGEFKAQLCPASE